MVSWELNWLQKNSELVPTRGKLAEVGYRNVVWENIEAGIAHKGQTESSVPSLAKRGSL